MSKARGASPAGPPVPLWPHLCRKGSRGEALSGGDEQHPMQESRRGQGSLQALSASREPGRAAAKGSLEQ